MNPQTLAPCLKCGALNRIDLTQASSKKPVCGKCQAELPVHDGVVEVSSAGLERLLEKSQLPVVVDFWAPWCGPCQAFSPVYQQAARQKAGQAIFAKLNTENDPSAGARYSIRGIPTLIGFKGGRERQRASGAMPLGMFLQWIDSNVL